MTKSSESINTLNDLASSIAGKKKPKKLIIETTVMVERKEENGGYFSAWLLLPNDSDVPLFPDRMCAGIAAVALGHSYDHAVISAYAIHPDFDHEKDYPFLTFRHQFMTTVFEGILAKDTSWFPSYILDDVKRLQKFINDEVIGIWRKPAVIYSPSQEFWWFFNNTMRKFYEAECFDDIAKLRGSVFTVMYRKLEEDLNSFNSAY